MGVWSLKGVCLLVSLSLALDFGRSLLKAGSGSVPDTGGGGGPGEAENTRRHKALPGTVGQCDPRMAVVATTFAEGTIDISDETE